MMRKNLQIKRIVDSMLPILLTLDGGFASVGRGAGDLSGVTSVPRLSLSLS